LGRTLRQELAKACVFCGDRPEEKTKEHIIPQWLIELTGDPNRIANLGGIGEPKLFAFDQFVFPACQTCNAKYSHLEIKAKTAIHALMNGDKINEQDGEVLLNWFDKVRIGMWLGGMKLHGNPSEIEPKFHISSRMGQHDRLLYIGRAKVWSKSLNFMLIDEPFFQHVPSVFSMYFNGFFFITVSSVGVSGAGLGLPYMKPTSKVINGEQMFDLTLPKKLNWRGNFPAEPDRFAILAQSVYFNDLTMPRPDNDREDWKSSYLEELRKELDGYGDRLRHDCTRSHVHLFLKGDLTDLARYPRSLRIPPHNDKAAMMRKGFVVLGKLRRHVAKRWPIPKEHRNSDFGAMLRGIRATGWLKGRKSKVVVNTEKE